MKAGEKYDFNIFVAWPKDNGWILLTHLKLTNDYRWISPQLRLHVGVENLRVTTETLLHDMQKFIDFEKQILAERWKGWLVSTPITNYKWIKWLDSVGATEYAVQGIELWFKKEIKDIKSGYSEKNVEDRLERKLKKENSI